MHREVILQDATNICDGISAEKHTQRTEITKQEDPPCLCCVNLCAL